MTNGILLQYSSLLISHKRLLIAVLIVSGFTFQSHSVFAQFIRAPHPRINQSIVSKSKPDVARKKGVSLSLPFWDDFSFTPVNDTSNTESNAPLTSLWLRGRKVWINDGMGINSPTINVATFDGLDSLGSPYSDAVLETGFRDTLESQPINLAEVIGADTNRVYLSFFYQWCGNGEPPDGADYMRLEFKNDVGEWENMMTINTKSSFEKTMFYDTIIQVSGKRFFHDTFQFRFKNYGRKSGPFDTWNIDYVYLNKGRTIDDRFFPDRAAASTVSSLFGVYSAMPKKHFFANPKMNSVKFDIKNLDDEFVSMSYSANVNFINVIDSVPTFYSKALITNGPVGDLGGLVYPLERIKQTLSVLPDASDPLQFDPAADAIEVELKMKVVSGDSADLEKIRFIPINLKINDTISTHYYLNDYYAYDDGVAEYSIKLTNAGNRSAYQFNISKDVPDSLRNLKGFHIYFPRFGVKSDLTVDFVIYEDNNGLPGEVLLTIPSYLIKSTGINEFQFVRIIEPLIVDSIFYIGWKASSNGDIVVGLDTSTDTDDKLFVYYEGAWHATDDISGSAMLRPSFGTADPVTGIEDHEKSLQIFPNPSKGEFYVKGKFDRMEIIMVTGQSISFTSHQEEDGQRIKISNPTSGLYILKIVSGNSLQTRKIVID
jgi:hypothetical protein